MTKIKLEVKFIQVRPGTVGNAAFLVMRRIVLFRTRTNTISAARFDEA
jgi:hypothetical protein